MDFKLVLEKSKMYAIWSITRYFIYQKPESSHNSKVRLEVCCQNSTIPEYINFDKNYLDKGGYLELVFDQALEKVGESSCVWPEITKSTYLDYLKERKHRDGWVAKEQNGRFWLQPTAGGGTNPGNVVKGWVIGAKPLDWNQAFNRRWSFNVNKYDFSTGKMDKSFATKKVQIAVSEMRLLQDEYS